jgi:hypothetical protein
MSLGCAKPHRQQLIEYSARVQRKPFRADCLSDLVAFLENLLCSFLNLDAGEQICIYSQVTLSQMLIFYSFQELL